MTTRTRYALKATTINGVSPIHGSTEYPLPVENADGTWTPGAWVAVKGEVEYRANGIHCCMPEQLPYWSQLVRRIRPGMRTRTGVVEYAGDVDLGAHGFAARRVRLVRPWRKGETL